MPEKRRSVWILNRPLHWCSQISGFLPRLAFASQMDSVLDAVSLMENGQVPKTFQWKMGTCWSGLHFSGELQQDRQLWTLALSLHASLHSGIEPRFLLLSSLQIICCLYKNILFLHESRPVDLEGKVKLKLVLFHNWFVWQPVRNLFPTTYPSSWRNFF